MARQRTAWVAVAAVLLATAAARPPQLTVTVDTASGAFTIAVLNGSTQAAPVWLRGLPPSAGWAGGAPLRLLNHTASSGTHPTLGAYTEDRFAWAGADGVPVETAVQVFADGDTALLEQHFPAGLANSSSPSAVLAFPAFAAGGRETELGAVTWKSAFSEDPLHSGTNAVRLVELPASAVGRANGGPVVVFDEGDAYRSLVVSPFTHFLATAQYVNASAVTVPCTVATGCGTRSGTDARGNPSVIDLGSYPNATRAECCQHCTANPRCEMFAFGDLHATALPGERATCWLTAEVVGTKPSKNRDAGCPGPRARASASASAAPSTTPWWTVGVSGEVQTLPAGFRHATVLSAGAGLTGALQAWGAKMRTAYNTTRVDDIALSHLSYWTDNGAYYYMYSAQHAICDHLAHGPMDAILTKLVASWADLGLPVRSVQLDDWWYKGGPDSPLDLRSHDHMCVRELAGKPALFPSGIPALPSSMGYTLYGPFFCPDSVYAAAGFDMVNSTDGLNASPSPDDALAFFTALFAGERKRGVAMTGYEVDFLQDQTTWFQYMVEEHDGAARWLSGMANAAEAEGMAVQFCMAHPAAFLHALSLPAVTNGRASGDYQNPSGNLLQYGVNAPFFAAVGIAPSKDNWWSTPDQPRPRDLRPSGGPPPCDGGSRNVTNTFLHALVATLSTGPVGFSDALGHTNASLVLRTCTPDGLLLKPSMPLAAVDRSFSRAHASEGLRLAGPPTIPPGANLWTTHTAGPAGSNLTWYFALSLAQSGPLTPLRLLRSDLWPPLAPSADVVVWHYADPRGTATLALPGPAPLANLTGTGYAYRLVAPVVSGWALLGEPGKLTPVSVQRAFALSANAAAGTLTVSMSGTPGEVCDLMAWSAGNLYTSTVDIGAAGRGSTTFRR